MPQKFIWNKMQYYMELWQMLSGARNVAPLHEMKLEMRNEKKKHAKQ